MAIDLKFSKSDASSNWGFRVVGGADFQQPLIVVKVTENSLAQQAGLEAGDVIVSVNGKSTSTLTHSEVQQAISSAGLEFNLGIKRGEDIPPDLLQDEGKEIEVIMRDVQVSVDESIIEKAEELIEQIGKEIFIDFGQHKATKLTTKGSGEKMVFSNATQTYSTTEEKYKQKKWSTFLMKPERPPPKSKKAVEDEKRMNDGYKIIIKKQSRRKSLPKEKRVKFDQNVLEIEHDSAIPYSPEIPVSPDLDSFDSPPESDSLEKNETEVDYNDENEHDEKYSNSDSEQCSDCEAQDNVGSDDGSGFEHLSRDSVGQPLIYKPISEIIVDPYSENAMTLEEQLRTVQKQLQALSQLPSSVQVTLDAVSRQIADIFSAEKENNDEVDGKDDDKDMSASIEEAEAESGDDTNSIVGDELEEDSLVENEIQEILDHDAMGDCEVQEEEQEDLEEINRIREAEMEAQRKEEEMVAKKEKEMEGSQKPTFRPIVLPGGRKWIDPDDVVPTRKPKMTDQKIMESIESSLEVISGKRKGINFMKYTPPQKKLDHLQRSEVYRLIHSNETTTAPSRGIVGRPEKLLPEQDYYEATRSNE